MKLTLALLATTVVVIAGCADRSGDGVSKESSQHQQIRELLKRPDIDDAVSRYEQMRREIRERIATEIDLPPWQDDNDGSASSCREFPDIDGAEKESRGLSILYTEGNLPDDKWPRAVEIFSEVIRSYGFESPPRVIVDRPGEHKVTAADQFGANVNFGTKVNTTLSLLTGCHPTETGRGRHTTMTG